MRWLVVALVVLAGCGDAPKSTLMPQWSPHECDATTARPSGNAAVRPPFHADLPTLIGSLEGALGIEVPAEPTQRHDSTSRYDLAGGGTLTITLDAGQPPLVSWVHPTAWPGPGDGKARIEQALRHLGAWGPEMQVNGQTGNLEVRQATAGGGWVAGALWHPQRYDQPGWHSSFDLRPAHDLSAEPGAAHDARPVAQDVADCLGQAEAPGQWTVQPQPHLTVQHQSLAWTFVAQGAPEPDHHCGARAMYIHVDATTHALHGWAWAPCD